jgi:phospholipid/cholesterol/gamma-HCH transport system permease protein
MIGKVQFVVRETGNMFAISLEGFRRTWDFKSWWREYLGQCWFIAKVCSIPVVLISIPFGAVIALHVGTFARQLGAESTTGAAMVLAIVREAAPVATALLIAGAGGSAMTADLGSRRIRSELDAMEVMGVDPVHRLVLPRLAAATLVALLLNGVVSFSGIAGGWVMAVPLQGGTTGAYFASFTELAQLADFWSALVKAAIFGFLAAAIACHYGYNAHGGPKAVGDAVNRAVVLTFIILFFVNFTLTALYFNAVPPKT